MVVIEKPDKTLRLCHDPKYLNANIVKDYCIIPCLSDLCAQLNGKQIFSVLDLKESFWQIQLDEQSSELCTFSTLFGCYKFNRLPFGLNIASEVFQKYNQTHFGDIDGVFVYIDDILISASSNEEHDRILRDSSKKGKKTQYKI